MPIYIADHLYLTILKGDVVKLIFNVTHVLSAITLLNSLEIIWSLRTAPCLSDLNSVRGHP